MLNNNNNYTPHLLTSSPTATWPVCSIDSIWHRTVDLGWRCMRIATIIVSSIAILILLPQDWYYVLSQEWNKYGMYSELSAIPVCIRPIRFSLQVTGSVRSLTPSVPYHFNAQPRDLRRNSVFCKNRKTNK